MNNILRFTITGKPIGQARARKGAYGNWYNPQSNLKNIIQKQIRDQLPHGFKMILSTVPIIIDFRFYFKPLKSQKIVSAGDPYIKKPDGDNIEKLFTDSMEKIVFSNDNHIYSSTWKKIYSDKEQTEIEVRW